jgi:mannose-6-phosphate isomerase-like protein (cupin superfamily)
MMKLLPGQPDVTAPDGSDVRILASSQRGSMAHFTLAPGKVSKPVRHRSVEEIWFILAGVGRMWMGSDNGEQLLDLKPGLSFVIATGFAFQFRNDGDSPLQAVAITMPPWPGEDEAQPAAGKWDVAL